MRLGSIITAVLFGIFLLIVLLIVFNQPESDLIASQLAFGQVRQAIGIFIATAAAFLMLIRALAGDRPARLIVLVFPLFAAVLLIEPSWSIALGLTIMTLAVAVRGLWSGKRLRADRPSLQEPETLAERTSGSNPV